MIVGDLIDQLKEFDVEKEVRFASQPNWPFEYSIEDIVVDSDDNVVYLAEESQIGYLPEDITTELGW